MACKVMVGLSGGVDSGVAALLLKEQGFAVEGVTLLLKPGESRRELDDARAVAAHLQIRHHVLDLRGLFADTVIRAFAQAYQRGRTPNPCVLCNRLIKFGAMLDFALEQGAAYIATGHYAAVERGEGDRYLLKRADVRKDQSYFLCGLTQRQLAHALFPLHDLPKEEARRLAAEACLPVAAKRDSQEICFVPDDDYVRFLTEQMGLSAEPGDFVDREGRVLGRHQGVLRYTIGQRKGLGMAFGKPMYVIGLDARTNRVVLGEDGSQYARRLTAEQANWIAWEKPAGPFRAQVKIRCQAAPAWAEITPSDDGFTAVFDEKQRSVTPGQTVALYQGDLVVGGGTILSAPVDEG